MKLVGKIAVVLGMVLISGCGQSLLKRSLTIKAEVSYQHIPVVTILGFTNPENSPYEFGEVFFEHFAIFFMEEWMRSCEQNPMLTVCRRKNSQVAVIEDGYSVEVMVATPWGPKKFRSVIQIDAQKETPILGAKRAVPIVVWALLDQE